MVGQAEKRFVGAVAGGLMAATLALGGCGGKEKTKGAKVAEAVVQVATVAVAEADAPAYITVTGTVTADQSSNVAAQVPGKVLAVLVELGQEVKAGQPLLRLDTSNAALGAEEAQAQLRAATAQRANGETECAKSKELFDKGAISKSQYERERVGCIALDETLAAATARTKSVGKAVGDGVIRAPFAGIVSGRRVNVGEWVAPGMGLITIVDEEPLKLELSVPELYTGKVAKGQPVQFSVAAFTGQQFAATIARMGGEIGRQTRTMTVEADVAPGSPVRAGMFAEARIVLGTEKRVMVPKTALIKRGMSWRLFVVNGGRAEERVVERGVEVGDQVAIQSGLTAGERVISPIPEQVVDGVTISF
ncbi:MAG: efflux RND transporter periplasmic adaptor subunit [Myxococcales bacterium]|nr:efflux RND transporter periplasmic adaptor subunit [Myxococcales bacterium]